eukprot:5410748-Prymnesium_polylepis.2
MTGVWYRGAFGGPGELADAGERRAIVGIAAVRYWTARGARLPQRPAHGMPMGGARCDAPRTRIG